VHSADIISLISDIWKKNIGEIKLPL